MSVRGVPLAGLLGHERLVEIVPNFSEGRNTTTIAELVECVRRVKDVYLLDRHIDPDHNRTVLTIVGSPFGVEEVAWRLAERALHLIDLRTHEGVHPWVGALDVLPCIPLLNTAMEDCVTLARAIGARIGREFHIPIFLYEAAATHPSRKNLAHIRRGGLGELQARMAKQPDWHPDFGPPELHLSGGAMAVGARSFLIAFNVNLKTDDISIAKQIAQKVREANGGLPALKAIGLPLSSQGLVQVSMNVTDYRATSLEEAYEAVKVMAARLQVDIQDSEIVGLVPKEALDTCSEEFLQLLSIEPEQVLEKRLDSIAQAHG